jgi:hypothetical protein
MSGRRYIQSSAAIFDPHRYSLIQPTTKAGKTAGCIAWIVEGRQLARHWLDRHVRDQPARHREVRPGGYDCLCGGPHEDRALLFSRARLGDHPFGKINYSGAWPLPDSRKPAGEADFFGHVCVSKSI